MAGCISFSLGGPIRQVFAGMLFTWWKKTSPLLLGGNRLGGWGGCGGGGSVRAVCRAHDQLCFTSGLGGTGSPRGCCGRPAWGVVLASPMPGPRSAVRASGGCAVMAIASSRRGQTGLGVSWRRRRRRRWWGVSSAQFLSLVSEEALPNKMSLSWDMPLSCDLVLMRNWALRNITLSCSCLSSR